MTLANIVRLNVYTTDVDELINQHFPRINDRFGNSRYATSVLGVAHLPAQFLVMLEATAVESHPAAAHRAPHPARGALAAH